MSFVYIESSAFLKMFKIERESDAMLDFFREHHEEVVTSELTLTEVLGNLNRLGVDSFPAHYVLSEVTLMPLKRDILLAAAELRRFTLRSLDAIHLASAMSLSGVNQRVVSYDLRFAEVARSRGMEVLSPE